MRINIKTFLKYIGIYMLVVNQNFIFAPKTLIKKQIESKKKLENINLNFYINSFCPSIISNAYHNVKNLTILYYSLAMLGLVVGLTTHRFFNQSITLNFWITIVLIISLNIYKVLYESNAFVIFGSTIGLTTYGFFNKKINLNRVYQTITSKYQNFTRNFPNYRAYNNITNLANSPYSCGIFVSTTGFTFYQLFNRDKSLATLIFTISLTTYGFFSKKINLNRAYQTITNKYQNFKLNFPNHSAYNDITNLDNLRYSLRVFVSSVGFTFYQLFNNGKFLNVFYLGAACQNFNRKINLFQSRTKTNTNQLNNIDMQETINTQKTIDVQETINTQKTNALTSNIPNIKNEVDLTSSLIAVKSSIQTTSSNRKGLNAIHKLEQKSSPSNQNHNHNQNIYIYSLVGFSIVAGLIYWMKIKEEFA